MVRLMVTHMENENEDRNINIIENRNANIYSYTRSYRT